MYILTADPGRTTGLAWFSLHGTTAKMEWTDALDDAGVYRRLRGHKPDVVVIERITSTAREGQAITDWLQGYAVQHQAKIVWQRPVDCVGFREFAKRYVTGIPARRRPHCQDAVAHGLLYLRRVYNVFVIGVLGPTEETDGSVDGRRATGSP